MTQSRIDVPSLFMVLAFTANMIVGFMDPIKTSIPNEVGLGLLICGFLLFFYVLFYLRRGFFGETEPKLDHLITEGPYRFCRHPQYLSFIIMIFGIDLMFRSIIGVLLTLTLSIPSAIYRAQVEDQLLRNKFREEWENYANEVGFMLPGLTRARKKKWTRTQGSTSKLMKA